MASTYSTSLRLELIGTGEQQGTWGTTTNVNLGTLLEQAICGYEAVTVTDGADTTLTTANGSSDQARNMTLNLTGTLTAARNVICPSAEKVYIVKNSTTGGFAVTFKVSGQTGVSIPNGATVLIYVDGTDARAAGGTIATGGTGASTAGQAMANLMGYTTTATSGGTTTLTSDSSVYQVFTGTSNHTVQLPVVSTLQLGWYFHINNSSTGTLSINSSGGNLIQVVPPNTTAMCSVISTSGTTAASWESGLTDFSTYTGTGSVVLNTDPAFGGVASFAAGSAALPSIIPTGDTNTGIWFPAADTIAASTGGSERMRLDSSGNLLVGTSTPVTSNGANLNIYGTSASNLSLQNATTGAGNGVGFQLIQDGTLTYLYNRANGAMLFATNNTERARIHSSGGVSIGNTTDPGATNLSVSGSIELGNATDTTLSRISAGVVGVEGVALAPTASPAFTGTPTAPTAAAGTNTTQIATTAFVLANLPAASNTQVFTSSGTWTKPTNASLVYVRLWGAGGGGASGDLDPASNVKTGGSGGSGGAYAEFFYDASDLNGTVSVVIGTGGTGGAARNNTAALGANGNPGGSSTFLTLTATGGNGGTTTPTNSTPQNPDMAIVYAGFAGSDGAAASNATGGQTGYFGGGGGGGGGGESAGNVLTNAGTGGGSLMVGSTWSYSGGLSTAGGGGAAGTSGSASATNGSNGGRFSGGGGGGSTVTGTNGGNGGNGGIAGGGGGGGTNRSGSATRSSGAGGTGGNGYAEIYTW